MARCSSSPFLALANCVHNQISSRHWIDSLLKSYLNVLSRLKHKNKILTKVKNLKRKVNSNTNLAIFYYLFLIFLLFTTATFDVSVPLS